MTTFIVENPLAPQAIGDTIASFAALHAAAWESPADVYLAAVACRELLSHPQITLLGDRPDHGTVLNIQELFTQYAGTGTSMTRAYLHAAGLHLLANQQRSPEVILGVGLGEEPQDRFDFLIAPFSASDNGTQTKVWSDQGWQFLIRTLTEHGQRVGILGGPQDNTSALGDSCLGKNGGVALLGYPLPEVCRMCRFAKAVITLDCGINWIAQGMNANHVLLLPRSAHPNWTANPGKNAVNLFVDAQPQEVLGALGYLAKMSGTN